MGETIASASSVSSTALSGRVNRRDSRNKPAALISSLKNQKLKFDPNWKKFMELATK
jgi:hypothetical protein